MVLQILPVSYLLWFHSIQTAYSLSPKVQTLPLALLVYVDDIVITGPPLTIINSLKEFLYTQFKLKGLGNLNFSLGWR